METKTVKKFPGTPFIIECTKIENNPDEWESSKVSIFRDDILIGEYIRNYPAYALNTFYPFLIDDIWYALYSAEYTATRVMKLHEDKIEDWCGEENSTFGFCPVELYIPKYNIYVDSVYTRYKADSEYTTCAEFIDTQRRAGFKEVKYCNFGFLSGCIWGDDDKWKLRYIDLSRVVDKILTVSEKFGYWELPVSKTLKECISMSYWEPGHNWVDISRVESINLTTNERG